MCFETGTLCVKVHVSINHVPLPPEINERKQLRGILLKSGPLDFATKNTFPLFFVGEEALVGVY